MMRGIDSHAARAIGWLAAILAAAGAGHASAGLETRAETATVILAVGAAGEAEYGENFRRWAGRWREVAEAAGATVQTVGLTEEGELSDRERLKGILESEPKEGAGEIWLVLIGHGTFDGREAKFNLRGPDCSASDLGDWLKPFRRPLAIINTASASAPFINQLSAPGRVVVTATRSGSEQNYARFGEYLSQAIADPAADLDKDNQVSLLEAFLRASRAVSEWYELEGRLATEHALLDDNGDGLGTPADWFRGIRAVKKAREGSSADGLRAHQLHLRRSELERGWTAEERGRRDALEARVAALRERKGELGEEEYYRLLEELLLEMARLYEAVETVPKTAPSEPPGP